MSDFEKLNAKLDQVDASIKNYEKSAQAAKDVSEKGINEVKAELDAQKKQLQAISEIAAKMKDVRSDDPARVAARTVGEFIIKRAAGTGTTAAGGAVVDDEVLRIIKSVQNQYGAVRQIWGNEIVPMKTDTLTIPVDTFEVSGISGTGNVPTPASTSENSAITESADAALDQVTITASKRATLNYISNELISDSFVDYIGAYLLPKISRQAAKLEDQIVFTNGLLASANLRTLTLDTGKTVFSDLSFDDLFLAEDEVVQDALARGEFYMHRSIVNLLRTKKGTNGQYLFSPAASGEPGTIAGYPYMKVEIMPTRSAASQGASVFALFGDPRLACVVGEVGQRRFSTSSEYRFNQDQLALRMSFRFGYADNANIGYALCQIKTAAA